MNKKFAKAKRIVKKYKQEHLLQFYNEVEENQKEDLLDQILDTNFNKLNRYYKNSYKDDSIPNNKISPINYYIKSNLNENDKNVYIEIGEKLIKDGNIAVVTLAGGQGTRLGYKGPKGCYEIDVPPKKSLFEFLCDQLKEIYKKYGVYLKWYIMTSISNDAKTKEYFIEKDFFDYPKDKIYFFMQDTLEIINTDGKIILDNFYTLKRASNGNGDIFHAFKRSRLQKTLNNIKYISVSGIDNIILDIVDPLFIGLTSYNKSDVASKSIAKQDLESNDWVFANVNNNVSIIDPKNLTEKMIKSKNKKGNYNYNQVNILAHIFSKRAFINASKQKLPYHRAYKKNDYINEDGIKVVVKEPNSFKFEKFIFDIFKYYKKFTLLEVERNDEFAPIKAFTGNATPETALDLYLKKQNK